MIYSTAGGGLRRTIPCGCGCIIVSHNKKDADSAYRRHAKSCSIMAQLLQELLRLPWAKYTHGKRTNSQEWYSTGAPQAFVADEDADVDAPAVVDPIEEIRAHIEALNVAGGGAPLIMGVDPMAPDVLNVESTALVVPTVAQSREWVDLPGDNYIERRVASGHSGPMTDADREEIAAELRAHTRGQRSGIFFSILF